jgi:prepilin-type N-terminal cleavage/methylation domain-containing protein
MMSERRATERGFTLVELLVVLLLLGVIGSITTSIVVRTYRTEQYQSELQQVMDDGRVSVARIRRELRGGRRVLAGSTAQHLYWWNDANQDGLSQESENIHYCVAQLGTTTCETASQTSATAGGVRWALIRWTEAGSQSDATVIARTLTSTDVFSGIATPVTETETVTITFLLEVADVVGVNGAGEIEVTADVRLRNVAI